MKFNISIANIHLEGVMCQMLYICPSFELMEAMN